MNHITDGLYKMQGEKFEGREPELRCHNCRDYFPATEMQHLTVAGVDLCPKCFAKWGRDEEWTE